MRKLRYRFCSMTVNACAWQQARVRTLTFTPSRRWPSSSWAASSKHSDAKRRGLYRARRRGGTEDIVLCNANDGHHIKYQRRETVDSRQPRKAQPVLPIAARAATEKIAVGIAQSEAVARGPNSSELGARHHHGIVIDRQRIARALT